MAEQQQEASSTSTMQQPTPVSFPHFNINMDLNQMQNMTNEELMNHMRQQTQSSEKSSLSLREQMQKREMELKEQEKQDEAELASLQTQLQEIQSRKETLEIQRASLEDEGRYIEAQACVDQLRELNLIEGKKIEQQMKILQDRQRIRVEQRQTMEVEAFDAVWTNKLEDYENQSKDILITTLERQNWEKKEAEQQIRTQLLMKKPKFSKQILAMRNTLEKLVKQRLYFDADRLRSQIRPLELVELEKFEDEQKQSLQNKMKFVQAQHSQEMDALKQRIKQGRNELVSQKEIDFARLQSYHRNIMLDLVNKTGKTASKTKEFIQKQTITVLSSPTKKMADYSMVASPKHLVAQSARFSSSPRFLNNTSPLQGSKKQASTSQLLASP